MDRLLDRATRRNRLLRRLALATVGAAVSIVGLRLGAAALRPAIARADVRTAVVDTGEIAAVIAASGSVVPEIEQVVSMPVDARVLSIRKRAGDRVVQGEAILDLDLSAAALEQEKLDQALAVRGVQQQQARLALLARLSDITGQRDIKALQLEALRAQATRDRQLHERGHLARASLAQSELLEKQAEVELKRITEEERHAHESTRAAVRGLNLEIATLRRERAMAQRQLERATTRADRTGVVTWTVSEEGAAVRKGDVIARISDLSTFRVDATVSEAHAQRLAAGLPVLVKIGETAAEVSLAGAVANVNPTIRDGVMSFSVALADKSNARLRSNLRVEVLVVTSRKARVLRIARGAFAEASGARDVFVVRGDRAVRTRVRLGLSGSEHFEVVAGLAAGDEAIISDMAEYAHLPEIAIR